MTDVGVVLIVLIITSSVKSLYTYLTMQLSYQLLLIHVVTALGFSAIFVLYTLTRKRRIWFILWYLLHTFYLCVNTNFFEFFGKFLHVSDMYILIPEVLVLAKHLDIPLDRADLIFIVDLPLFLYLVNKKGKNEIPFGPCIAALKGAIGITALATCFLITVPIGISKESVENLEDSDIVSRYGFIGHNVFDLLMPSGSSRESKIKYGPVLSRGGNPGKRPNIVLIQFESLDANVVNYRVNGSYVAPFLHDLTTKSMYYPFTLCYRRYGGTSDCEIAVNNSIEPLLDFPLMKDEKYRYPNSVVRVLKKNGYSANAYHGAVGWYYKRLSAYSAMGYDNFFDSNIMKLPPTKWGASDGDVLNYVEKQLPKERGPFFVSIISLTSHEPFTGFGHFVPDHRFDGVEPKLARGYFQSVAYTDQVVGAFIEDVQKKYPDTYFFLYGDHTPFVINEGAFKRSVLRGKKQIEMVPLFIITPDGRQRIEHSAVASYLDIAPTILHAAGFPFRYKALGVDLLADNSLRQPVSYRGELYDRSELFTEMSETLGWDY